MHLCFGGAYLSVRFGSPNLEIATGSRPVLGPTQPPIQWVPEVKWPGRETDHSLPSSAEVKNAWR